MGNSDHGTMHMECHDRSSPSTGNPQNINPKFSAQNASPHQVLAGELAEEQQAGTDQAAASAGVRQALSALEGTMAEVRFSILKACLAPRRAQRACSGGRG